MPRFQPMQWRSHPILTAIGALFAMLALGIVVLAFMWDWNWFRPMVERAASSALERPVSIERLRASLRDMTIEADGIAIGNPQGFPDGSRLGSIDRLAVTFDLSAAFHRRIHIVTLIIDRPRGDLGRGASGKPNWVFGTSSASASKGNPPDVLLGKIIINDGHVHIVDPVLKSDFVIDIRTEPSPKGDEERLAVDAKGTYINEPISVRFRGGSLLSFRDDTKPYPIDLKADHGETHVRVEGTVQDPMSFGGANVRMHLEGKDLSELSELIAVPLAPTPPYRLDGHLAYVDKRIRFDDFNGKVGSSDLAGKFEVELGHKRPSIAADMRSETIDLTDLGGFIGATPGKSNTPDQSDKQKQERAEAAAKPTLFPDKSMDLSAIRNNDFDVRYSAKRIQGESMPLDDLQVHLVIDDGVITLDPLKFGIGIGAVTGTFSIDARPKLPVAKADVELRQVDLRRIMQSTKTFEGAGLVGGHAVLKGRGASFAEMLGSSDGDIKFFMTGGDMSALLVNLAGLDFGNSLLSAIGIPSQTEIRCMVSDFGVDDGVLDTRLMVLDTTAANVVGRGDINLRDQTIDYRIATEPKHFSIGSLPSPITITGPLKKPDIGVDKTALGARAGAAAVLGALLTPLGALIPTIQLGLGKDSNCNELVAAVQSGKLTPVGASGKKEAPRP